MTVPEFTTKLTDSSLLPDVTCCVNTMLRCFVSRSTEYMSGLFHQSAARMEIKRKNRKEKEPWSPALVNLLN